ncbi:MAG TPA: hypothetical protein VF752_12320, partial [Thermoleophilaceae bacterium]
MAGSVDLPRAAVAFGRRLRAAGLPVTPGRAARFAESLALLAPLTRERVYWAGRASFVSGRGDVDVFDRVFGQVFDGLLDPADARGERGSEPVQAGEPGDRAAPAGAREVAPLGGSGLGLVAGPRGSG